MGHGHRLKTDIEIVTLSCWQGGRGAVVNPKGDFLKEMDNLKKKERATSKEEINTNRMLGSQCDCNSSGKG